MPRWYKERWSETEGRYVRVKNPFKLEPQTLLILGAIGAGLYLAYKLTHVASAATNAAAQGIADLYVWFTSGPPVQASGSIIFQDGSSVPIASIPGGISFNSALGVGQFTYNGQQWAIYQGARDANGNYPAVPFASVQAIVANAAPSGSVNAPASTAPGAMPVDFGTSNGWG